MLNNVCVIPARMASTRFPGKPLAPINGYPMVGHVAQRCKLENSIDRVIVATCDQEIADFCSSIDVESIMTSASHVRASDRIQEAVCILEKKIGYRVSTVTMVQGDEPMVTPSMIKTALNALHRSKCKVVNLVSQIHDLSEAKSPNSIKVVLNELNQAMFMSRSLIPSREHSSLDNIKLMKQVCIIPFERDFLDEYVRILPTDLEKIESIDMLRCLGHGHAVHCEEIFEQSYPVDTPDDLRRVEAIMKNCELARHYIGHVP